MRVLVGFLFLLAWNSHSFAYGALAQGTFTNNIRWTSSTHQRTAADAATEALKACLEQGQAQCEIIYAQFKDTYLSLAVSSTNLVDRAEGDTIDQARRNAIAICTTNRRAACIELASYRDVTPTDESAAVEDPLKRLEALGADWGWQGPLRPVLQVFDSIRWTARAVTLILFAGLIFSLISSASPKLLSRRAIIFAWIALPSIPCFVITLFSWHFENLLVNALILFSLLWTDVFAAMGIGFSIRPPTEAFLFEKSRGLSVLSLPLTVLIVTLLSFAVILLLLQYGSFVAPSSCLPPPYSPPVSTCGFFQYQGFYYTVLVLGAVLICGVILPANSNLIRGYVWLTDRVGRFFSPFDRRINQQPVVSAPIRRFPSVDQSRTKPDDQSRERSEIKKALRTKREEFEL
jgi:hypothetical protein